MLLGIDDYIDPAVDPLAPFESFDSDEALEASQLDASNDPPPELIRGIANAWTNNALRMQQGLVFRLGASIGVLKPIVPKVIGALSSLPVVSSLVGAEMILEAVATSIGIASEAMSVIPIAGNIVKAGLLGADIGLRVNAAMETPGTMIGKPLEEATKYSTENDADQVRKRVNTTAETRDWTKLFLPRYRGKLAARALVDRKGHLVIAWGLRDDSVVPRIVIDKRPVFEPYTWHFSDDGGAQFSVTGGMGAVPGAPRIISSTQCTVLEPQNIHRGHETLGDPRCGSSGKTVDINVGLYLPNAANGAWSLYGYATKPSPSSFTINAQAVLSAWEAYVDAIWEGVDRLWRNESWEGGWGCGLWQNALQGLVRAHCVGNDNEIGGFGAWAPPEGEPDKKLTAADRDAWGRNNFVTQIVKPAMMSLREMQLELLRSTPMAAYLPRQGLGAFDDVSIADEFHRARTSMLNSARMSDALLLTDVVDHNYLHALKSRGRGTYEGDGGIRYDDYKPPRLPLPDGASGADEGDGGGGGLAIAAGVGLGLWGLSKFLRRRSA